MLTPSIQKFNVDSATQSMIKWLLNALETNRITKLTLEGNITHSFLTELNRAINKSSSLCFFYIEQDNLIAPNTIDALTSITTKVSYNLAQFKANFAEKSQQYSRALQLYSILFSHVDDRNVIAIEQLPNEVTSLICQILDKKSWYQLFKASNNFRFFLLCEQVPWKDELSKLFFGNSKKLKFYELLYLHEINQVGIFNKNLKECNTAVINKSLEVLDKKINTLNWEICWREEKENMSLGGKCTAGTYGRRSSSCCTGILKNEMVDGMVYEAPVRTSIVSATFESFCGLLGAGYIWVKSSTTTMTLCFVIDAASTFTCMTATVGGIFFYREVEKCNLRDERAVLQHCLQSEKDTYTQLRNKYREVYNDMSQLPNLRWLEEYQHHQVPNEINFSDHPEPETIPLLRIGRSRNLI